MSFAVFIVQVKWKNKGNPCFFNTTEQNYFVKTVLDGWTSGH